MPAKPRFPAPRPDAVVVGFDDPAASVRRERWPQYKAQREAELRTAKQMTERAQERKTFGKYLHQHGSVSEWIAKSRIEIDQARLWNAVEAAQARLVDEGDTPRRAVAELNKMNHGSSLKNLLEKLSV